MDLVSGSLLCLGKSSCCSSSATSLCNLSRLLLWALCYYYSPIICIIWMILFKHPNAITQAFWRLWWFVFSAGIYLGFSSTLWWKGRWWAGVREEKRCRRRVTERALFVPEMHLKIGKLLLINHQGRLACAVHQNSFFPSLSFLRTRWQTF